MSEGSAIAAPQLLEELTMLKDACLDAANIVEQTTPRSDLSTAGHFQNKLRVAAQWLRQEYVQLEQELNKPAEMTIELAEATLKTLSDFGPGAEALVGPREIEAEALLRKKGLLPK